jgi:glycosyltransferase involved in cell wall biosynthesis
VLTIAHFFPPASAVGVLRPLRVIRRLAQEGCRVTVLTASPQTYSHGTPLDPALMSRIPEGTKIIHAPVIRPSAPLLRLRGAMRDRRGTPATSGTAAAPKLAAADQRSLVRRAFAAIDELTAIPDKQAGWIAPAILRAVALGLVDRPDVLYSTAPPWTSQVVALAVARILRVPWVADFRDPWARAPWRESQPDRIRRASARLEPRVLAAADAVLFTSQTNRDEYAAYYGERLAVKFHLVPNGCDPEEFAGLPPAPKTPPFRLVYAGSMYGHRSPLPIFRAAASLLAKGAFARSDFRLRLIGDLPHTANFPAVAKEMGLQDIIEFVPRVTRKQIGAEMAAASALLLLQPGTTVAIPGKVYEYLAIGRPILAFSEPGELAALLDRSGVAVVVTPDAENELEGAILKIMELARVELPRPAVELYDGNQTAAHACAIIQAVAEGRSNRRSVGAGQGFGNDSVQTPRRP